MGRYSTEATNAEKFTLKVDDRGRVLLAKQIRDRLGVDSNDEISATLIGSVLELKPQPSLKLETATADRDSWGNTIPTDAGEILFARINE